MLEMRAVGTLWIFNGVFPAYSTFVCLDSAAGKSGRRTHDHEGGPVTADQIGGLHASSFRLLGPAKRQCCALPLSCLSSQSCLLFFAAE
jgi:hypothetical protein